MSNLRFSANLSLLFQEVPLLERFALAKQAGFQAVEIQFPYPKSLADLKHAKADSGLDIALINLPAGDLMEGGEGLAAVPERREQFQQALEKGLHYAEALEVSCVNVLPGRCLDTTQAQTYRQTLAENLRLTAQTLHPLGMTTTFEAINTEDMPGALISTVAQMQAVMAQVRHPGLRMQYDIYHMQKMGEPVVEQLPKLIEAIGHIQFADVPGRGEPGSGQIDFAAVFQQLEQLAAPHNGSGEARSSGYRGWLGAEYHPTASTQATLNWMSRDWSKPNTYE